MKDMNIHLTNANTLTHQWEPTLTERILSKDANGYISVIPNTKRNTNWPLELQIQAKLLQEFRIFTEHCQAMTHVANEIKNEIESLPNTDITQYHQKISTYQGVINLLSKHANFLRKTAEILKTKYQEEKPKKDNSEPSQALFISFETFKKQNDDELINLEKTIREIRIQQKLSAGQFQQERVTVSINGLFIHTQLATFEGLSFGIGNYEYQNKDYKVNLAFKMETPYNWAKNLNQNLLGSLLFKTTCSDPAENQSMIQVAITWVQNEYPKLFPPSSEISNNLEPTAWGVHYPSLVANRQFTLPNVEPTLLIEFQKSETDDLYPIRKLYQTLVEWMQIYNFSQIVIYDFERTAPIHYSFGFSCLDNTLSEQMKKLLSEHLERGQQPTIPNPPEDEVSNDHLPRVPFTIKRSQLATSMVYLFESSVAKSYAELIKEAPILNDNKVIPNPHPMISGVDFIPYSKSQLIFSREIGRSPIKKMPVKIQSVPVDYNDLTNRVELMACAQINDADLVHEKTIFKVKR